MRTRTLTECELKQKVGNKIRILRKSVGMNQTQYAKLFKKTQQQIAEFEAGKRLIQIPLICNIAIYHGIQTDEILLR